MSRSVPVPARSRFALSRRLPSVAAALLVPALLAAGLLAPAGCRDSKQQAKVVNVYCWSEYIPQDVRDKFEAKTGIKVNVVVFENNEQLVAKLQAGVSDFDLVVPSDYTIALLKRENLVQKIDRSKIGNWKNLDAKLLGRAFDPANDYSMPLYWGTTGIGFNREATGEVDSWNALFDQKYAGKILMLKDSRECFAAALKRMGKSINETDPAVLKQAAEMLQGQKKLVRTYNSDDFDKTLERGDVVLSHGYNGQLAKLVATNPKKFGYAIPKEGATIWVDSVCIPAKARNVEGAHAFLDFLLEPDVGASMVNQASYASSNVAARKGIKPEILNDKAIYPPDEVVKRCEVMQDIGPAADTIAKLWEGVMLK